MNEPIKRKANSGIQEHENSKRAAERSSALDLKNTKSSASRPNAKKRKRGKLSRRKPKPNSPNTSSKARNVLAYRYRNVFKCILRTMHRLAEERGGDLMEKLLEKGLSKSDIAKAFDEIKRFRSKDFPAEICKKSKIKVEGMLEKKSVQTYILKESLQEILNKLQNDESTQILPFNKLVYIEACTEYIERTNKALNDGPSSSLSRNSS